VVISMTGFAAVSRENDVATVGVTVRAVNHRFLDLQVRVPQSLAALEPALRGLVQRHVARGRVELSVSVQPRRLPAVDVQFNESVVHALAAALDRARAHGLVGGPITLGDLLRVPQALSIVERVPEATPEEQAALQALVEDVTAAAIAELQAMRVREGGFLDADLEARRAALGTLIDDLEAGADEGRAATEARLAKRVEELRVDAAVEPGLLAQEIVRAAARSDIHEEVVRFRGHLAHWRTLAEAPEPCGRKLDFLLQEMNREVNTIGSKAEGPRVPELVVRAKAELEKMREQIQNVE